MRPAAADLRAIATPRVAFAVASLLLCAACASAPGGSGATRAPAPLDLAVLSSAAVPGLAQTDRPLSAPELAKDASVPGITAQLGRDGYLGGLQRTFQGPSRHLTLVTSRGLAFSSGPGAAAFLSFVRAHADAWFGIGTQVSSVVSARRPGLVFEPASCACHLANPVLVAVVQDGPRLAWLEINGPDATRQLLLELMAPARSTEAG
jgi:hypothetical protein